jgi:hypothetical protein
MTRRGLGAGLLLILWPITVAPADPSSRSFSAETRLNQATLSFDRKVQFT